MRELTGKQRRALRGLGQQLKPRIVIGKAGLTDGVVSAVADELSRRELLKVCLPRVPAGRRRPMADDLARAVGAPPVGLVGRAVLLYRPDETLPPEARIALPSGPARSQG